MEKIINIIKFFKISNLSILLVFLLFGCQTIETSVVEVKKDGTEESLKAKNESSSLFSSRDLETDKYSLKKTKVGIFVPMSGKHKDLGTSIINAATISLFDNDNDNNIELVFIDSTSDPENVKDAFKKVVDEEIKIVIGPIFSQSAQEIANIARKNEIIAISLSNNADLANNISEDGGVFIAGMLVESQIDKIVSYAILQGKKSFSIIAPNNQYGQIVSQIYKKIVRDRDGLFINSSYYSSREKNLDKKISNILNSFLIPEHLQDGRNRLKKDAIISDNDRIYSDVILIPESGKKLSMIAEAINRLNIDEREYQIIGTSQWDDISTLNNKNLIGAWFASPKNEDFRRFEKVYYKNFEKFPPRISSIAYDSLRAIAKLVKEKNEQAPNFKDFINYSESGVNGFKGIDGLFRFLPNGLTQRNLAILEVRNSGFEVLEDGESSFVIY
jgi:ABC-type branched-subunit amino acid transport system substrate-binding protein